MRHNRIEIGEVSCDILFEHGFFEKEFTPILSDYNRWGFGSDKEPEIQMAVTNEPIQPPILKSRKVLFQHFEYDSIETSFVIDAEKFIGRICFGILRNDRMAPVRIIEMIETFIFNIYLFYFVLNDIGTFIHSAGISDQNGGYIFTGASGSGKSTIAKLSRPRKILCDDLVLLRSGSNGSRQVFGTPFFGDSTSTNESAECRGIYFIEQKQTHEIDELGKMSAIIELMKEGVVGRFFTMKEMQQIVPPHRYLNLFIHLFDKIPCYKLKFRRDNSFWELINAQFK